MLRAANTVVLFLLCVLMVLGCDSAVRADDFQRLQPDTCTRLDVLKFKATFPAEWRPYLSSARCCQLVKKRGVKSEIVLVSVFAEDYYYAVRGKPASYAWEDFPKTLLFNSKGEQVGAIERMFPVDNISEIVLTYGYWLGNIPGEIRTHVISRLASSVDLPTLLWDVEKQRYVEGDSHAMSTTVSRDDFQRLLPDSCVPLASTKLEIPLAMEWKRFSSATRVCSFLKQSGAESGVVLISVSPQDYYRSKPADAAIENFPEPLLFDSKGRHIGKLKEPFLNEEVVEMVLTYGQWQDGIPGEIRMYISNPTVTGDYNLPTLLWNKAEEHYVESDKPVLPVKKLLPE